MKKYFYLLCTFLIASQLAIGQGTVTGTLVDVSDGEPLIGASVSVVNSTIGTVTNIDGEFTLENVPNGEQEIEFTFIGYELKSMEVDINDNLLSIGEISLRSSTIGLSEVNVIASTAIDRKTPVAVSTVRSEEVEELSTNREFPEVLETTPSVYVTKQGGGFGDARLNVRGFNQKNTAVLINGIPVNDMENGRVYWSNWAGLSDVTRTIQVQRGLGASKLAIPSVGGTVNIITKTTDQEAGGSVSSSIGNNGFKKFGVTLSTGKTEDDWAFTLSGSRTTGNGYIEGTYIDAWSYFASISKEINSNHLLQFTAIGAPQRHGQRDFQHSIGSQLDVYGPRYNDDFGYKNGQSYLMRENFYHKPQMALNHYWNMDNGATISTSAYYSIGRGGGTGDLGGVAGNPIYAMQTDSYGHIKWDEIVNYNSGKESDFSDNGKEPFNYVKNGSSDTLSAQIANSSSSNGLIKRASMNEHNWMGVLSTVNHDLTDNLSFLGGIDGRYYKGIHYRKTLDLLGNDYYFVQNNVNQKGDWVDLNRDGMKQNDELGHLVQPNGLVRESLFGSPDPEQRIDYDNDGLVTWIGGFSQMEYSTEFGLTAFLSAAVSNKSYKRVERFLELEGEQESDWYNFLGGNVKAGLNYNLNENHNVFFNTGYYSNQPTFDGVFPNFNNEDINEDVANEKVIGFELGYGYRNSFFTANLNGYHTQWRDKQTFISGFDEETNQILFTNMLGLNATHMGVELDFIAKLFNDRLEIGGMASVNDWKWTSNAQGVVSNENNEVIEEKEIYTDGLKVGDAAQTTFSIKADLLIGSGISVDARYSYFDNLYANFEPEDRDTEEIKGVQPIELPSYGLTSAGLTYKFNFLDLDAKLRGSVNNLFNVQYISEATDDASNRDLSYEEQLDGLRGWYGFGRTWSATLKFDF